MNTTIQITYLSRGQRVYRGGTFPLKRRKPEQVLKEWIKEIRREMEVDEILRVVIDGEEWKDGRSGKVGKAR